MTSRHTSVSDRWTGSEERNRKCWVYLRKTGPFSVQRLSTGQGGRGLAHKEQDSERTTESE